MQLRTGLAIVLGAVLLAGGTGCAVAQSRADHDHPVASDVRVAGDELDAWLARAGLEAYTGSTITDEPQLRAELRRVRRRGWAELVNELEDGHASLAVPVRDAEGALVAAVGLSGPTFRLGRTRRRELLPLLHAVAGELEAALARPSMPFV